jgi:hypothetical protein
MREKLLAVSSLTLGVLLLAGAGCMPSSTTNTDDTNTTIVAVDDTDAMEDTTADDSAMEDTEVDDAMEATDVASPTITITSPADGDTVESNFDVTVEIANFELAPDEVEGANVDGHGHYHVWVDGEYYAAGVANTTAVSDLAAGEHEIQVSLQQNDHSDLDTAVKSDPIIVTVQAAE